MTYSSVTIQRRKRRSSILWRVAAYVEGDPLPVTFAYTASLTSAQTLRGRLLAGGEVEPQDYWQPMGL